MALWRDRPDPGDALGDQGMRGTVGGAFNLPDQSLAQQTIDGTLVQGRQDLGEQGSVLLGKRDGPHAFIEHPAFGDCVEFDGLGSFDARGRQSGLFDDGAVFLRQAFKECRVHVGHADEIGRVHQIDVFERPMQFGRLEVAPRGHDRVDLADTTTNLTDADVADLKELLT